jgi:tRNA nucleotidyltransferase/poly(A) polymerase
MENNPPPPELTEAPTILDRSRHPISRRDIDTDALKVLYRLHKNGHTAYLVGGAVRDLLLRKRPYDFDISTDAHPNRIKKLFANAFLIGRRFRLAHIRFSGGKIIEVSTFRKKPEDEGEEEEGGERGEGVEPREAEGREAGVGTRLDTPEGVVPEFPRIEDGAADKEGPEDEETGAVGLGPGAVAEAEEARGEGDENGRDGAAPEAVITRAEDGRTDASSLTTDSAETTTDAGPRTRTPVSPAAAGKVRKPIAFGTPREDAFRRDITINALFYDIATFSVIDYVGGLEDLAARRVRIIGDPDVSYTEDPVRIWRVLRHAARLGFSIEEETGNAIARHSERLAGCAGSRLFEELNKDFKSGAAGPFFELVRRRGLLPLILGGVGEFYGKSDDRFASLADRLATIDASARAGIDLSSRLQYALFFWPWAKTVLARSEGDKPKFLFEAAREAKPAVLFPKGLLIDVFHTLVIVEAMLQALRTGHMRWSLRKRSHYPDASLVASLLVKGTVGEGPDPFERMMAEKFPTAVAGQPRKRRRRPRRRRPPN